MIKEFRNYAIKVLRDKGIDHKIKAIYTVSNWRLDDVVLTKELPEELKELGYRLPKEPNKKGYYQVYQPQEPYNRQYAHISPEMLKKITRH